MKVDMLLFLVNTLGGKYYSFVLGSSSPDSIRTIDYALHAWDFAVYQYQFALNYSRTSTFDPVQFALGYGSHLAEDLVGHFKNGYLNPKYNYPLEFAADSYQVHSFKPSPREFKVATYNRAGREFIYQSQLYFSKHKPSYKPRTKAEIEKAIYQFEIMILGEAELAKLNLAYKDQMVKYDFCNSTQFDKAEQYFKLGSEWSWNAAKYWIHLLKEGVGPNEMSSKMRQFVTDLFAKFNGTSCNAL